MAQPSLFNVVWTLCIEHTEIWEIVDEDNFFHKMRWRPVKHAVYRADQDRPCLVVEYDYNARIGKYITVFQYSASVRNVNQPV